MNTAILEMCKYSETDGAWKGRQDQEKKEDEQMLWMLHVNDWQD